MVYLSLGIQGAPQLKHQSQEQQTQMVRKEPPQQHSAHCNCPQTQNSENESNYDKHAVKILSLSSVLYLSPSDKGHAYRHSQFDQQPTNSMNKTGIYIGKQANQKLS